jgi:hypothetical protein
MQLEIDRPVQRLVVGGMSVELKSYNQLLSGGSEHRGDAKMNSKSINLNVWALILSTCLGVIITCAGVAEAQERSTGLQANNSQLTSIEALFTQIEAAKTDRDKDKLAGNLESRLATYAKAMVASFTTAIKQAQLAAKTRGKEGSVELLKTFEDLAVDHENRLKRLDDQGQKMKSGSTSEPAEGGRVALGWRMLDKISDFFISPAQAAIAVTSWNVCHGLNSNSTAAQWAACANATSNAATQTTAAYATFNACWNGLDGVRPKWWRAIRRAGCVAVLVAKLA